MEGVNVDDPRLPGLLRLPEELRLIIYHFLRRDTSAKKYRVPDMDSMQYPALLYRRMRLPLLRVCRRIRHEAIQVWYGQKHLDLVLGDRKERNSILRWLRRVNPYALTFMKGVTLQHREHHCTTWFGRIWVEETTVVGFGGSIACATGSYVGGCCDLKRQFDTVRDWVVQDFQRKVEAAPETLKVELIQLVLRLFSINEALREFSTDGRGSRTRRELFARS